MVPLFFFLKKQQVKKIIKNVIIYLWPESRMGI